MKVEIFIDVAEAPALVGFLRFESNGGRESSSFEYASSWLEQKRPYALEPGLPLVHGPQFWPSGEVAFHRIFDDIGPDGWGKKIFNRDAARARKTGREKQPRNSLDYLLAVDDFSRQGAIRFRTQDGNFQRPVDANTRTPPLIEIEKLLFAANAIERDDATAQDINFLLNNGVSLGGMRPKASVIDGQQLMLAKFPSPGDSYRVPLIEAMTLDMARRAGITTPNNRIITVLGQPVLLLDRFDRNAGRRIHFASAATLLGVDPKLDHCYTDIAEGIRKYGAKAHDDLKELWTRMVFTVLVSNVDDHLKNHAFLNDGQGAWRLSPAYDVNPMPGRARDLKTWISEEGPEASIEAAMAAAPFFDIDHGAAKETLQKIVAVIKQWKPIAKRHGLNKQEIEYLSEAFEHREADLADEIARSSSLRPGVP